MGLLEVRPPTPSLALHSFPSISQSCSISPAELGSPTCIAFGFIPRPGLDDGSFSVASQSSLHLPQTPNTWICGNPWPKVAVPRGPGEALGAALRNVANGLDWAFLDIAPKAHKQTGRLLPACAGRNSMEAESSVLWDASLGVI